MKLTSFPRILWLLSVLTGALTLTVVALPAPIASAPVLGGKARLFEQEGGYVLEQASRRQELPLPSSAVVHTLIGDSEHWFLTAVDGVELLILAGSSEGVEELASPPPSNGSLRSEPEPLIDARGLQGLVWLEGDAGHQLAVKAAGWTGSTWTEPQALSPPGPGSQLALTSVALGHSSWLVAWSAFDGQDSEVRWSRFDGRTWSPPARVTGDNQVPDTTPELWATSNGAVLAWSRYDGNDYRLTTASFDGEAWSKPREIGPPGSYSPSFADRPGSPLLLCRLASPQGWLAIELDDDGQVVRQAQLAPRGSERPTLVDLTSEGPVVLWPGEQLEVR